METTSENYMQKSSHRRVSLLLALSIIMVWGIIDDYRIKQASATPSNPVGNWKFEEGVGGSVSDSSGNGKTGTLLNGVQWTVGKVGNAVTFDGVNDHITLPSAPPPVPMTVVGWIRPGSTAGSAIKDIFSIRGGGSQANTFLAFFNGSRLRFVSFFDNGGVNKIGSWLTPLNSISLNNWQHIALTYDGSSPNNDPIIYINGQQVQVIDDVVPSGTMKTGPGAWSIGNSPVTTNGFNGAIDELKVYNQILTPADVLDIYNAEVAPPTDTTPPSVNITYPANGATVAGSINVTAISSDNLGVVGVQFQVDGVNMGIEDATSPYSGFWDTTLYNNSTHTITAIARDAAGNTAISSVTVTVYNQKISDITYCNNSPISTYNLMDINYPPQATPKPMPTTIFIHGGGWQAGAKEDLHPMPLAELNQRGYIAASINYRLAPTDQFPTFVEDIKCAVRYLRANANYYGIDPAKIGVWGESAGGHLVSMLGTLDGGLYEGNGGYQNESSRVQAVIDLFGPTDLTIYNDWFGGVGWSKIFSAFGAYPGSGNPVLVAGSPINYATSDDPPFLIIHGDQDTAVLPIQSNYLQNALTTAGVSSQLVILPGFAHGGQNLFDDPQFGPQVTQMVGNFFDSKLKYSPSDTTPPTVSVISPTSGATAFGVINVTANAADNVSVAGVQFKLDGANLGAEDLVSPYTLVWDTRLTPDGAHTLNAVARDTAGNTAISPSVNVTVDNLTGDITPPSVVIINPLPNDTVSGSINVNASAIDNVGVVGVQFKLDGVNLGIEDLNPPYGLVWDTTMTPNGPRTITATARDAAGNLGLAIPILVNVSNDTLPPSDPTNLTATSISHSSIQLNWTASIDNVGVSGYKVFRDGLQVATTTTTSYLNNGLSSDTTYSFQVSAFDLTGNISGLSSVANATTLTQTQPTLPLFDHFSGTALDSSTWTAITANAGSITTSDSYVECDSPSSNAACAFYYNATIDKSKSQLWVFAISNHSDTFPQSWISLVDSPTPPTAETLASWSGKLRAKIGTETSGTTKGITFSHWNNTHSQRQWNGATNVWANPTTLANSPIKGDDYYLVGLEIDGQNNRWRMLSWHRRAVSTSFSIDQGLRLYAATDWVSWSSMESTNSLWLVIGEPVTDSMSGKMRTEWIRADSGQKQHVWTNGRNTPGPYVIKHSWGYPSVNGIVEFMVPQDRTTLAINKGPTGSWDSLGVKDVSALYDPADGMYYLVYRSIGSQTVNLSIGFASSNSPDGPWVKFAGNPIITPGGASTIIKDVSEPDPNKRFKIYYGSASAGSVGTMSWATAPAMVGPWTKQGLFMDTFGQVPGGIDESGRGGFNPVLYNGIYYLMVGARPAGDPSSPSGMSYSYGPSLGNLTHPQITLVPYRATPAKNLTANLNGRVLTILDTTGYVPDGYIEISNSNGENSGTRIRKVIDGTTLELYHGLDGFTTSKAAKIIQVDGANRIGPSHSPMYRNGKWYVYMTPFNFFGQYPGYGNYENIGLVSSGGVDQPYTWNHLATPTLMREFWHFKLSNENPSILHTDIESVTIP